MSTLVGDGGYAVRQPGGRGTIMPHSGLGERAARSDSKRLADAPFSNTKGGNEAHDVFAAVDVHLTDVGLTPT